MRTEGLKLFTLKDNGRLQKATAENTARERCRPRETHWFSGKKTPTSAAFVFE